MFSSWFDHTIKATLVASIWQVQEYDDARMLAFSREHYQPKVSVPCSVNLKVSNAITKLSASIGLNCGHCSNSNSTNLRYICI
jgi:hypothetical protein